MNEDRCKITRGWWYGDEGVGEGDEGVGEGDGDRGRETEGEGGGEDNKYFPNFRGEGGGCRLYLQEPVQMWQCLYKILHNTLIYKSGVV